jgi:hypothetical protein
MKLVRGAAALGAAKMVYDQAIGAAQCPQAFSYESRTYFAYKTEKAVKPGRMLGEVGYATCDDSGGQDMHDPAEAEDDDAAARFRAHAIAGVDPADAFVVPSEGRRHLYFSASSDGTAMPPEHERPLNH